MKLLLMGIPEFTPSKHAPTVPDLVISLLHMFLPKFIPELQYLVFHP